jgi:hypothetical protein
MNHPMMLDAANDDGIFLENIAFCVEKARECNRTAMKLRGAGYEVVAHKYVCFRRRLMAKAREWRAMSCSF